jgi:hypothetical protein
MTDLVRSSIPPIVLLLAALAGCGDDDGVNVPSDAGRPPDVPLPAQDAAAPLVVQDGACGREFQSCQDQPDDFCTEFGLDCVPVGVDSAGKICLRRCESTRTCPYNSYCVPDTTKIDYGGLILAARHCFLSFCGKPYGNGEVPFGTCLVGGDNMARVGPEEQRPGTCVPVDSDAGVGVCTERGSDDDGGTAGVADRDESCTSDMEAAGCPARGQVIGCAAGMVCVGRQGDPEGQCRLLCDPGAAAPSSTASCAPFPENPKQWCWDLSSVLVGASGRVLVGYWGVCTETPACDLFSQDADCRAGEGCIPTTMVSPHGVCFGAGQSTGACAVEGECAPGLLCTLEGDGGACRELCDMDGGVVACGGGEVCQGVALDPQSPQVASSTWGVCAAPGAGGAAVTPDGGVGDAP